MLGKTVFEIYRTKDAERIDASDNEALAGEFGACSSDYEIEMPDGDMRVLATSRIVTRDAVRAARDISSSSLTTLPSRKKSEQRIAFMAHHDVLTGLANRLVHHGENRRGRRPASQARRFIRRTCCSTSIASSMSMILLDMPLAMRCCGKRPLRLKASLAGNRRTRAPGRRRICYRAGQGERSARSIPARLRTVLSISSRNRLILKAMRSTSPRVSASRSHPNMRPVPRA